MHARECCRGHLADADPAPRARPHDQVDFSPREVQHAVRALQATPMKRREEWFEAIRSCRRRPRRDWRAAPVARIFAIADDSHLWFETAARLKLLAALEARRLHPREFFRVYDVDADGYLSSIELRTGPRLALNPNAPSIPPHS